MTNKPRKNTWHWHALEAKEILEELSRHIRAGKPFNVDEAGDHGDLLLFCAEWCIAGISAKEEGK